MLFINNLPRPTTPTTPNRPTTPTTPNRPNRPNTSTSNQCSICLSSEYFSNSDDDHYDLSQTQYVTSCGHFYHYQCIMTWTNFNNNCPMCRTVITNHNHENDYHENDNHENDNHENDNHENHDNHISTNVNDLSYNTPPPTRRSFSIQTPPRFDRTNYNVTRNSYHNNTQIWASVDYNNNYNDNNLTTLIDLTNILNDFINIYPTNNIIHRTNNLNHIMNLINQEIYYYQTQQNIH